MKRDTNGRLPAPVERVRLKNPIGRPLFRLFAFIVCLAVFVAFFAVSGIWSNRGTAEGTFFGGLFHRKRVTQIPEADVPPAEPSDATEEPPREMPAKRPDGAVSVFTQTISGNIREQSETPWRLERSDGAPEVLIVCTYPQDAYLAEPAEWIDGSFGDAIVSQDGFRCVTSVGKALQDALASNGVEAVYAETEASQTLRGAYARSAAVIAEWLKRCPTVRYVVDVGRDVLFDGEGRCLRTAAGNASPSIAQVSAVVGTDHGGVSCPAWEENLAFAEAFGREMDRECPKSFRGVTLRTSPVNQQFAPRSLKLEIGSCANTIEEATRAAQLAGKALANILTQ